MNDSEVLFNILNNYLAGPLKNDIFFYDSKTTFLNFFKKTHYIANELLSNCHKAPKAYALSINKSEESICLFFAYILAEIPVYLLSPQLSEKEKLRIFEKWQLQYSPSCNNVNFSNLFSFSLDDIKNSLIKRCSNLDGPVFWLFTSGSSGGPKAVGISLKNILAHYKSIQPVLKFSTNDLMLINLPTHHVGGLMIFWRALFSGSRLTFDESSPYNIASLVPLQLERSIDSIEKFNTLRAILVGGSALSPELRKICQDQGLRLFETYGMTESTSSISLNGKILNGVEVKITDNKTIAIKGDMLSSELPLDHDGFYHTLDLGFFDENGNLKFIGRNDLLFKSGGEFINPNIIEKKLKSFPGIEDAYIVPIPHPKWGYASTLVFSRHNEPLTHSNQEASDFILRLKIFIQNELHPFWVPKFFFNLKNHLSHLQGKINRNDLISTLNFHFFNYKYIPCENSNTLMVFFHGFMGNHTHLLDFGKKLLIESNLKNENKMAGLFIDLPGHGNTDLNNFDNRTFIFLRLKALIECFEQKNIIFYGYSMGGRIALELSLYYLKPKKLILESANLGPLNKRSKKDRIQSDQKMQIPDSDFELELFLKNIWYENPIFSNYKDTSRFFSDLKAQLNEGKIKAREWKLSLINFYSQGLTPYFLDESISMLNAFTKNEDFKLTLIAGDSDKKYSKIYKEVSSLITHTQFYKIKNSGHNPHKMQEEFLINIIVSVLMN